MSIECKGSAYNLLELTVCVGRDKNWQPLLSNCKVHMTRLLISSTHGEGDGCQGILTDNTVIIRCLNYFDMIIGTGTSGISALFLGHLCNDGGGSHHCVSQHS